jgi:hypothetical protein
MDKTNVSFYQKNILGFESQITEMINTALKPYRHQLRGERQSQSIGKIIDKGFWEYSQVIDKGFPQTERIQEAKKISKKMAVGIANEIFVFFQGEETKTLYVIDFSSYQKEVETLLISFGYSQ